jgi:phosphoenolpyruvate-protein kinase (PTS system EI component)
MSGPVLRGLAAAGGVAVGRAFVLREPNPPTSGVGGPDAEEAAIAALARVAEELGGTAARLKAQGRLDEAEIFESNRLMAGDPALAEEVRALAADRPAPAAIVEATERHARALAALPSSLFAARASDVRRLGRRAAAVAAGSRPPAAPTGAAILVARDLAPADVVDLDLGTGTIKGIALAEGSGTSHAAIMARAGGLPMAVALGDGLLTAADGDEIVVDGDSGVVVLRPSRKTRETATAAAARRAGQQLHLAAGRSLPAQTLDGRVVGLLANASTAAEAAAAAEAGAQGIGLLRTELAFLKAGTWPSQSEHAAVLAPVLEAAPAGVVTVRTLDFGEDKTPPFLAGRLRSGVQLMLDEPGALEAQLGAILRAGRGRRVRILLPLVVSAAQIVAVRAILDELRGTEPAPLLGAMIESPEGVERSAEIVAESDFVSIGTNDLVQYSLGLDRSRPLATAEAAADPAVLAGIGAVVTAAHAAGRTAEVCGEAAGEPPILALLVGLGVDELSVSPARLDLARSTIRRLEAEHAVQVSRQAVAAGSAAAALELARGLLLEAVDEVDQSGHGLGGVGA